MHGSPEDAACAAAFVEGAADALLDACAAPDAGLRCVCAGAYACTRVSTTYAVQAHMYAQGEDIACEWFRS